MLATLQLAIDNIKEELVKLKALAASNNIFCNGKLAHMGCSEKCGEKI